MILNRVVWSAVSALIFYSIYAKFDFHQQPIRIKWPWKKEEIKQKESNYRVIKKLTLPKVNLNFGLSNQLKQLWLITISDLKYILKGWPFVIISLLALAFTCLTIVIGSTILETPILPVTWELAVL